MAKALMARLARLESLESVQMPTVIEYHRVVSVRSDDHRRGSCVVQGNEMTFFASSAAEYEQASARQAAGRNIILIAVDARCINFQQEGTQ
ncbi:hypothetical protein Q4S47_07415 [Aeromonas caviae]|uniref:hypothetical protein n=1 Tax=Aeromonas TaxID=642 RepID=UPI001CD21359|nr:MULTISPECIES: hypothetical protein [Aeromonas]MDH1839375.1 hypothetical protein [Aeromonas caviae]MDX7694217.1 hypothetical protein [Aeromonas caviae]UBS66042.1 hypothetical protein LCG53_03080 [Aeromonas caviae]GKQ73969.1 hypothetical protein KAM447_04770 [Aeromonas caviae]